MVRGVSDARASVFRRAILSHWATPDDKTANFMIDMERRWAEGRWPTQAWVGLEWGCSHVADLVQRTN